MSLAEKKVEKLLLNKDSSSEILSASEEEVQVDAFSCILREKKDYVLTKENREKLKNELKGVLISCREKKREQLREIWKEYRLGFLKKPITDIRTKNDFKSENIFDDNPPQTSSFDLKNVVIISKSFKILEINKNNECFIWKETKPTVIVQFPFLLEKGFQKEEVFDHDSRIFTSYEPSTKIQESSVITEGIVKEVENKYVFYLNDPSFSSEKWIFETNKNIQVEKIDEKVDLKEESLILKTFPSYYISKVNVEKRFVYGPVLIPDEFDAQGDIISAEEIQNAAWNFMENYGTTSFMHTTGLTVEGIRHQVERAVQEGYTLDELINGVAHDPLVFGIKGVLAKPITFSDKIKIRETYLAPIDFKLGNRQVKEGTWIMGMHIVSDLLWEGVISRKITGFSIEGQSQKIAE